MAYGNKRRLLRIHQSQIVEDVRCQICGLGKTVQLSIIDFNRNGAQVEVKNASTLQAIETAAKDGHSHLTMAIYFGSMILRSPRPFRIVWINHNLCRMGVEFLQMEEKEKEEVESTSFQESTVKA